MTGRLLGGGDVRMGESSADWRRRIGYAVVHGLVLLAVLAASPPHNSGRSLLLAAAVSTASFLRLQGSDPGFLTEGAEGSSHVDCKAVSYRPRLSVEMLVDVDADDEAEYRRERIKQLEAALGEQSDATDQSDCSGEGDDALVASLPATAFCADCGLLPVRTALQRPGGWSRSVIVCMRAAATARTPLPRVQTMRRHVRPPLPAAWHVRGRAEPRALLVVPAAPERRARARDPPCTYLCVAVLLLAAAIDKRIVG